MRSLPLFIAFTFGALVNEVAWLRSEAIDTSVDHAYHEGCRSSQSTNGFRIVNNADGSQEIIPMRVEEDEPGWDCHTMGNKKCSK